LNANWNKDQILGNEEVIIGPDGKPVTIGKVGALSGLSKSLENILKYPLAILAAVAGLVIALVALSRLLPMLGGRNKQQSI
jgi:glutamine amidotransferase PdxT